MFLRWQFSSLGYEKASKLLVDAFFIVIDTSEIEMRKDYGIWFNW